MNLVDVVMRGIINKHVSIRRNIRFTFLIFYGIPILLKTPLEDKRKFTLWWILIPYLKNIKKLIIQGNTPTI
jgi:hypothetical protein